MFMASSSDLVRAFILFVCLITARPTPKSDLARPNHIMAETRENALLKDFLMISAVADIAR